MMNINNLKEFYNNKRILITGHTGFKGTWLSHILSGFNAQIYGYALTPPNENSLFDLIKMEKQIYSYTGDIRDYSTLNREFDRVQPEIVIHMAAQPLVRESYRNPVLTYETNVMGAVNLLECIRQTPSVKSVVNVTTDKVYLNNEWNRGYVETDYLDGYDPYSNSKSCSELVTHSYVQSFLKAQNVAVSTCRAGNVIGGGDSADDRIIPDCVRAATARQNIIVRNPHSTRPYQHVLEPLFAYLMVAMEQYQNPNLAGSYNVGPEDESCITTGELVDLFCSTWREQVPSSDLKWIDQSDGGPHEANFLKLDCTKLKKAFNWKPQWSIETAIQKVIEFEKNKVQFSNNNNKSDLSELLNRCMKQQISEYMQKLV